MLVKFIVLAYLGLVLTAARRVQDREDGKNSPQILCGLSPIMKSKHDSGAALEGELPFHVMVSTSEKEDICGGALIGRSWVLTAASCVVMEGKDQKHKINVVVGESDLQDKRKTVIGVERVYPHENYNSSSHLNNLAILKLKRGVEFGFGDKNNVNSVCLPEGDDRPNWFSNVTMVSYGVMRFSCANKLAKPKKLTKTASRVVQVKENCGNEHLYVTANSSGFDVGAPLIKYFDDKAVLVGLVSDVTSTRTDGSNCSSQEMTLVAARVSTFVGWINSVAMHFN